MRRLLKLRRTLQVFYNKNAVWIQAVMKFLMAFSVFQMIQMQFETGAAVGGILIAVGLAGVCAFLSTNAIAVVAGIFLIGNLALASMEMLAVGGSIVLIVGLLYFGMGPKDSCALLLVPLTLGLHIPSVIPVVLGLIAGPSAALGIAAGTVLYYVVRIVAGSSYMAVPGSGMDEILRHITGVMDELTHAKDMAVMVGILLLVFAVVSIMRRMSVDYAWYLAIGVGVFSYVLLTILGILLMGTQESVLGTFLSAVLTAVFALAVQTLLFSVDYRHTERIQFEDDEYYYYVKAVPKMGTRKTNTQKTAYTSEAETYRKLEKQTAASVQQDPVPPMQNQMRQEAGEYQRAAAQRRAFVEQAQREAQRQTGNLGQEQLEKKRNSETRHEEQPIKNVQKQPAEIAPRYTGTGQQEDLREQQRQEWLRRRTEQGGSRYDRTRGG